jgi:hypothetical protein
MIFIGRLFYCTKDNTIKLHNVYFNYTECNFVNFQINASKATTLKFERYNLFY